MTEPHAAQTRVFSGIQPSGQLNIGHYMGAIRHWLALQKTHDCLFCIVDLHTLTAPCPPDVRQAHCYDLIAHYLACGIDPEKSPLFLQSHVPAHSQLTWILTCLTHMGELSRMTQFKEKSGRDTKPVNVGLFNYPMLMAADILLYQTHLVPVGEDQKQHLELARQLATRFNKNYGRVFILPKAMIAKQGSRIMRLQDPTQKMSKSDPNLNNTITLQDPPDRIVKKIKRAVTDSHTTIRVAPDRAGMTNLLTLFSEITHQSIQQLESHYVGKNYSVFKQDLADALIHALAPMQERFQHIRPDTQKLDQYLNRGAEKACVIANQTLDRVHQVLGLIAKRP